MGQDKDQDKGQDKSQDKGEGPYQEPLGGQRPRGVTEDLQQQGTPAGVGNLLI